MRLQSHTVIVLALALLAAGFSWLAWPEHRASGAAQAAALSAPLFTARWRYAPVPEGDMAAIRQSDTQLDTRYHEYQRAWHAYVAQLHNCQTRPPALCTSGPQQAHCQSELLMQCLSTAIPTLASARGALHDQAIGLEQAAQQLAGDTE